MIYLFIVFCCCLKYRFEEGVCENAGEEEEDENQEGQTDGIIKNRRVQKNKDVVSVFKDLKLHCYML